MLMQACLFPMVSFREQVVGWPPVRSYRRTAIAARSSRPCQNEGDVQSAIFVKVNMDGIPIGRKVDLNAYSSYEGLLSALEGMFHSPHIGKSYCHYCPIQEGLSALPSLEVLVITGHCRVVMAR